MDNEDFVSSAQNLSPAVSRYSPLVASTRFSTSTYGKAIAVAWGQPRISANTIFTSAITSGSVGGVSFTTSSAAQAICEGPILAFRRIWMGKTFFQSPTSLIGPQ